MRERITRSIQESLSLKQSLLATEEILEAIQVMAESCIETLRAEGRILLCGNGGSAADAQHIAAELSGRFELDRPALDAEALHVNTSALTSVANDYDYDEVYARMVEAKGRPGDVLLGLSTSGKSRNVVRALEVAREKRMKCFAMTGQAGKHLASQCDAIIAVPSTHTARIQESHILIGHILCHLIEQELHGGNQR